MKGQILALVIFSLFNLGADERSEAKDFVNDYHTEWDGWCTKEKALHMVDLIMDQKPLVCVEIGVFGGASLFPTAHALKCLNNGGVVYAIDPWRNEECVRFMRMDDPNFKWWAKVDLNEIFRKFNMNLEKYELEDQCVVIPETSHSVVEWLGGPIDILHIDGNHSEESSLVDAMLYLNRVKSGGYIWFNEVHWNDVLGHQTTKKAFHYLLTRCILVNDYGNYVLFKKL